MAADVLLIRQTGRQTLEMRVGVGGLRKDEPRIQNIRPAEQQ